jgi:hypothetical protein
VGEGCGVDAGARPPECRRGGGTWGRHARVGRWGGVLLLGVALSIAGSFAAAGGQTPSGTSYSVGQVVVGAVDAPGLFPVEEQTFTFVANELAKGRQNLLVPMQTVLGDFALTLTNTTAHVDSDLSSVAFVGTTTNAGAALANMPANVLVLVDWEHATSDTKPSLVVSARTGPARLGQALKLAVGSGIAADLTVSTLAQTVGVSNLSNTSDQEFQHVSYRDNLTAAAQEHFTHIYSVDGLALRVPALLNLDNNVYLSATLPLDILGDIPRDVLGYQQGASVIVEGSLGVTVNGSAQFSPTTAGWSLSGILPRVSVHSFSFPYFLNLPDSARFSLKIAYTEVADSTAKPKPKAVTVTAGADMTTDLFGHSTPMSLELQVSQGGGQRSLAVSASFPEAWEKPFGIDFLTVGPVFIDGSFKRTQASGTTPAETKWEGSILGWATIAGRDVEVKLEGKVDKDEINAEFGIFLTSPINTADLLGFLGANYSELPFSLRGPALESAGISIGVKRPRSETSTGGSTTTTTTTTPGTSKGTTISIVAGGTLSFELLSGSKIGVSALFSLDHERKVIAAVRSAGTLSLSSLLAGAGIDTQWSDEFDFTLADDAAGSAFGFIYSTVDTNVVKPPRVNDLPRFARVFYRPLFGHAVDDPTDFDLLFVKGVNVLGAFNLPSGIAGIVDTVGVQSKVFARGRVPIFDRTEPLSLAMGLRVKSDQLPDLIDQVGGDLKLDTTVIEGKKYARLSIDGRVRLRLPAGLPEDGAGPLRNAGVPVETFEKVPQDYTCLNGNRPLQTRYSSPAEYRCYDVVELGLSGGFIWENNALGLDLLASIDTVPLGADWHPFGFEWLGISNAKIHIAQAVTTAGELKRDLGFQGDIKLAGKDFFAAVEVALVAMAQPPWVKLEFKGLKVASGAGLALSDFFSIQHELAKVNARITGAPEPPRIPDLLNIPNVAMRNLEFTLSPHGVPLLCIPQGLVLSGDLYVNPSGEEPAGNPGCGANGSVIPPDGDKCHERRADGCLLSSRLKISYMGIEAYSTIGALPFDFGPFHWDDLVLDMELTPFDQHLMVYGGAQLENFTGSSSPENLASGEFRISFKPAHFTIFGEVEVLEFGALVDVTLGLDVLRNPDPKFELHVLLATDEAEIQAPSFESAVSDSLTLAFLPLTEIAGIARDTLDYFGDEPLEALSALSGTLNFFDITSPGWADEFPDEYRSFLSTFELALEHAPGSFFDLVMNGIPEYEFEGVDAFEESFCVWYDPFDGFDCAEEITICFGIPIDGGCYVVPPFDFPGTPGLCDIVFDGPEFDGLRNSDGDCTFGRLRNLVESVFEDAIDEALDFTVNLDRLLDALIDGLNEPMLDIPCAEYRLRLGTSDAFTNLAFVAEVFGQGIGFNFGFDFFNPAGSIDRLFESIVRQLTNPGSVTCIGYQDDIFGAGTNPTLKPRLTLQAPATVDEASRFSIVGSFGLPLPEERTVNMYFGDGFPETVTVPKGATGFQVEHSYGDDEPTATSADAKRVIATDTSPGGRSATATVIVKNVAPKPTSLTVLSQGPLVEASRSEFAFTFDDPGPDQHRARVEFGDGRAQDINFIRAGERTVRVAHIYRDDNPTGTPFDVYNVRVTVFDDDHGASSAVFPVTVHNVAPHGLGVDVVDQDRDGMVEEREPVTLRLTWSDAGTLDNHRINVDWGDSSPATAVSAPIGRRSADLQHVFGDNGTFQVQVTVTDDDGQSVSTAVQITVGNVDPHVVVDLKPTHAAPAGPTFMVRRDVALSVTADTYDPGSDDLTFGWAWGDGATDVDTDRVNPPQDDPLPSPSVQPRTVTSTRSHTYTQPCLYRFELSSDDDDAGRGSHHAPVVVVGNATRSQSFGWWSEEYRHYSREGDTGQVDDRSLACYLLVVKHLSSVFGEGVSLETADEALGVLLPQGGGGQRALRERQLDQALLAAWLNVAHGAAGTEANGMLKRDFARILYDAEAVRRNAASTADQLFAAQQTVETAVRNSSR